MHTEEQHGKVSFLSQNNKEIYYEYNLWLLMLIMVAYLSQYFSLFSVFIPTESEGVLDAGL